VASVEGLNPDGSTEATEQLLALVPADCCLYYKDGTHCQISLLKGMGTAVSSLYLGGHGMPQGHLATGLDSFPH